MPEPILVLNCGSSSIKYQMIDAITEEVMAKGLVQKIGDVNPGSITHEVGDDDFVVEQLLPDHTVALQAVVELFHQHGPDLASAVAVAHRTVHGGELTHTTVIDDDVVRILEEASPLAPLHNPPGIAGIQAARTVLPDVPHVGVFDTAFFAALPAKSYTYALDTDLARRFKIRKYGFHGTSHAFVSGEVAKFLGRDDLRQIVCHIGNGASMSAVDSGKPIDTSMGMTPLQGLVMGTRPGDVDPGLHMYLSRVANMSFDEIDTLLNRKSGMLGLTGVTDMRDVYAKVEAGDQRAILGFEVYVQRLIFYIGAYHVLLGGAEAITFTAGVGENSAAVRAAVCAGLGALGVVLDEEANHLRSTQPRVISTPESKVAILVVPTNEELAMARETVMVLAAQ